MIAQTSVKDQSECPGRERLYALSLGRLRGEARDQVERHIEVCDSCVAALHSIDDRSDPLIADLRGPIEPASPDDDSGREWTGVEGFDTGLTGSDGSRDPEARSLGVGRAPDRLGDYRFDEPLGRGGMGTVYRAFHTRLGKVVALKVLRPDRLGDPAALARFRREMRALGGLEHRNLVRALDAREEAGVPFLVMEYVEGADLTRLLLRQGRLRMADACEVVRQAAIGLDYAHRNCGLVHRDIKPSNLMITPEGCVKILDLGIARFDSRVRGRVEATRTDGSEVAEQVGTYDYMAPEQWLMSPEVDIRTDVYGLGCTLYELLAGSAPYARPEWTTRDRKMRAHALIPAPPILERRPDVPGSLSAVLDRMLAKCPADRYATPADVVEALEPFTPGHDLPALSSPTRSAPTIAPVLEPVGATSKRWHPRWDWSRRPTISRPMAVAAVLIFVSALVLANAIAGRRRTANSDPAPVAGDVPKATASPAEPAIAAVDRLPAKLAVRLYRIEETDDLYDLGRIGDPRDGPQAAAFVGLRFVVEATFDEPLFPYVISVNQAGIPEVEFPEDDSVLAMRKELKVPSGDFYLPIEEQGLLAVFLLGSRRRLSAAEALGMVEVAAEDWKRARTGVPWLFDGERCEPLVRDRGGLPRVAHGLKPFRDSCRSISSRAGIAAVRAIAFPVNLAPKNP